MCPVKRIFSFIVMFFIISCSSEGNENINEGLIKSSSSDLISFQAVYKNSIFDFIIDGTNVVSDRKLPYECNEITINDLVISPNATANFQEGSSVNISNQSFNLKITAEDGVNQKQYQVNFQKEEYPSVVEQYGLLTVSGNKIIGNNDQIVSLAGNSFFWSNNNWGGNKFYKSSVVDWLKLDWNTTIVRAAMGVDDDGGYLSDKLSNKTRLKTIVDAAIDAGVYVIIDWHSHHAEDYENDAIEFFQEMALEYGQYDNVIYEIYNEPLDISWDNTIKPYAENVIAAIRAIDPDNLIVVGTPEWSQRVDLAAANPITNYSNIAYTLHFYSVHHNQWLRDRATAALNNGIALFVTEWGVLGYTQNDPETESWMEWCKNNELIHLSWAVNDKEEEWSIVKPNSNTNGQWQTSSLTDAGILTRQINRNWNK